MKPTFPYLLSLFLISFLFFSCGDGGKAEKAKQDWVENADSVRKSDSIAKAEANEADKKPALAGDLNSNTNTPKDRNFIKTANVKFRVKNVRRATEFIEDLTAKYDGYVKSSNLVNRTDRQIEEKISNDSIRDSKLIVVENQMEIRVPGQLLDSLLRGMNPLIDFLDCRAYNMDDVTSGFLKNVLDAARVKKYEQRQTSHIDSKSSKLKDATQAEDNLLEKQRQADDAQIKNDDLAQKVKYATVSVFLYQKPVIVRDIVAGFDGSGYKASFGKRVKESIANGWSVLEEIIVFLINLWSIILLVAIVVLLFKYISGSGIFSKTDKKE